jgi:hypothetical protein
MTRAAATASAGLPSADFGGYRVTPLESGWRDASLGGQRGFRIPYGWMPWVTSSGGTGGGGISGICGIGTG